MSGNTKFSALPAAAALSGTEPLVGLQGGAAVQIKAQAIADLPSPTKAVAGEITGINNQAGTTYVLQATDKGGLVRLNNANPVSVTVPVGFKQKTVIFLEQVGAGQVSLVPGNNVTLDTPSSLATRVARSTIALIFHADDAATVVGDLA